MSKVHTIKLEDARIVVGPRTTTSGRYPTTAEWLAKREGVVVVAQCWFSSVTNMWGPKADWPAWQEPVMNALATARSCNSTHLLIKINDDAQTIRVLVDGDDALVVVHVHDCGYHKSMRRGMQVALRGLKELHKAERETDSEVLSRRARERGDSTATSYVTIDEMEQHKAGVSQEQVECSNNSPPWFTGRWRDWHRGHGCNRDDGKPRTAEGAREIAAGGVL